MDGSEALKQRAALTLSGRKVFVGDEFHRQRHDRRLAGSCCGGLFEPMDGGDVRVVERGEDVRLAPEPGVVREVDLTHAHAARADRGSDFVETEAGTCGGSHAGLGSIGGTTMRRSGKSPDAYASCKRG